MGPWPPIFGPPSACLNSCTLEVYAREPPKMANERLQLICKGTLWVPGKFEGGYGLGLNLKDNWHVEDGPLELLGLSAILRTAGLAALRFEFIPGGGLKGSWLGSV